MTGAILASVLLVAAAAPEEGPVFLDALVEQAAREYDEGRLDEALATLERARTLAPRPSILYNIAQVHRARNDCPAALAAYAAFLAETTPEDPNRDRAVRRRAEMQECVDRRPGGARPAPAPAPPTGPAPVRLAAKDRGSSPPPAVSLAATAPEPAPPAGRPRRARIVGWTLVGTGVVAAGAAAYLAWRAASIDDELSGKRRVVWDEALMQRHDQGERDALWARISAAGAVLLGGGGVAVLVLSRPGPEPGSPVALLGWSGGF